MPSSQGTSGICQFQPLVFYVNGRKIVDNAVDPEWTLLEYLRDKLHLRGTKLGCGEGGCGACTVMVSGFCRETQKIQHDSVNACLAPICSVHKKAVTTIEGIGSTKTKLHEVQERIAKSHGSQCGFCTPGIVMSMYTLLRNNPHPEIDDIEAYMQGNLCRCTGYRPIMEAWMTFTPSGGCCGGMKNGVCCQQSNGDAVEMDGHLSNDVAESEKLVSPSDFCPYDPTQEPIFPPELLLDEIEAMSLTTRIVFTGPRVVWFHPKTLPEVLEIKAEYPSAKIVVGNTEVGVEVRIKKQFYQWLLNPSEVTAMTKIELTEQGLEVGAAVTLSVLETELKKITQDAENEHRNQVFAAILEMLRWFSGKQIRNVAAIGGNIMTASPISDLNPLLMAAGASLLVQKAKSPIRRVALDQDFFIGYRKHILEPEDVLISIFIPFTRYDEYFYGFKQARRREDDIAIVNAGMRVALTTTCTIKDISLVFGGMAATTIEANGTAMALVGRPWIDSLPTAIEVLLEDLPLDASAPGGMPVYRQALALSFFQKFWIYVTQKLTKEGRLMGLEDALRESVSCLDTVPIEAPKTTQIYSIVPDGQAEYDAIGRPLLHSSAFEQATGEARYCNDTPKIEQEAAIAFVYSKKSKAKIIRLDPSLALAMEGVIGWVSGSDVPKERQNYGLEVFDEQVFWNDYVTSRGQLIGGIVADTHRQAKEAATKVMVEYEDEPGAIITIQDAIKAKSFYWQKTLERGDVDKALKDCVHRVKGDMYVGGQEHFYLEGQNCLVIPKGERDEVEVLASVQDVKTCQHLVAHVLGIPANRVVVRTKRIGGGFGGKEFRCLIYVMPSAVAATKFQRPIRCWIDRDEDMASSGQRHAFFCEYEVGADASGKILAVDLKLYNNAGYSLDLSSAVMQKGMFECTNAYEVPNVRVCGNVCKTNIISNTAFRGFGAIQCMMIAETWITHLAEAAGINANEIRQRNFVREGSLTHFQQEIKHCTLQRCWDECKSTSDYENRLQAVQEFNRKNKLKKRGLAMTPTKYGIGFFPFFLNQGYALVHIYLDGSVMLNHGGVEMGQGLHTKMIQVASRALRIPASRIHTVDVATDKTPNTTTTAASVGADLNGGAVQNACETLLQRLEPFIAANPKGSWEDWVQAAFLSRVSLSAAGHYKARDMDFSWETGKGDLFNYFCYGAACAEVEVDCLTGDHRVLRADLVMDVGESLNPAIDIGQIEGAFVQGYGLYTMEEPVYGPDGILRTTGPGTYKIPGFGDIPQTLNVSLLRGSLNRHAVYSSKAVGEPPLFLSSSVFFAIRNAIKAYREENQAKETFTLYSPATSERIRIACEDGILRKVKKSMKESTKEPWAIQI